MTPPTGHSTPLHLVDRHPQMSVAEMLEHFRPPAQFDHVSLDNYIPDPNYPSQQEALDQVQLFSVGGTFRASQKMFSWGKAKRNGSEDRPGIYLDGGFGVGKTHLLAALWRATPGRTYYGTFIEYTSLVGALGYRNAVDFLRGADLLAIDEFELDDPGDTMVMSRLLGELVQSGTRLAATSNTPPNALGEGRFASEDFLREITALSDKFLTVRIEGEDYRKRDFEGHALVFTDAQMQDAIASRGGIVSHDSFDDLIGHLATVHPSRYVGLVEGVGTVCIDSVHVIHDQAQALRLVAFIDRLYDAQVAIVNTGVPLDTVFDDTMLAGGYRKKYMRAQSRMIALTRMASDDQAAQSRTAD
jgi:cell division protein ZapE